MGGESAHSKAERSGLVLHMRMPSWSAKRPVLGESETRVQSVSGCLDVENIAAPGEDRTHDLQMARVNCDYETDALPTALPRQVG